MKKHCIDCGKIINNCSTRCRLCAAKKRWQDPNHYVKISEIIKKTWENPARRIISIKKAKEQWKNSDHRNLISQKAKEKYQDPKEHIKTSKALKEKWKDPEFRAKHCGENNHFYIHGKSEIPYGAGWTESLKQEIRDRDCHLCRNCEVRESDRAHDVHHIDFNKKNNNPINLITLCKKCHNATKSKYNREKWTNYFQETQKEVLIK